MAAVEKEDRELVRAALILVTLRNRKLRSWPEWVPMQPSGEVTPPSGETSSSSARTVAVAVPIRRQLPERVSMQSGVEASAGAVAARVPERWPKAKRSGARGETSNKELPEQGHAAAAAAAKGSGAPRSSEQERCAEMPAASAQQRQVVVAFCYAAVAGSGSGPSSTSAARGKEPMKTPSPNTPLDLDYGAGGSGAPSSADDAAPARPQAKRKGTGARGSVGGGDDEGCSSPAKRGLVVSQEEKPMSISVEPSGQSETCASSGKGAPRPFDLNLCPDDCPNTT